MQAVNPNPFQFLPQVVYPAPLQSPTPPQDPLQNNVTTLIRCDCMNSLLERIVKVFTAIVAWIQSLFCGQADSPQRTPSPQPPSTPATPAPLIPPRVAPVVPLAPAVPVAPVVPVAPEARTQQFLGFYRGANGDVQQRMLAHIWGWDDNRLEAAHDYIQWIFPNHRPSAFNAHAPLLNDTIVQAFNNEQILRTNLLTSFNRMLRFYGLQLDEGAIQITRAPNAPERQAVWLTPGNHNYLRMTRILICLQSLGFPQHAQAFYQILNDIAQNEGQNRISQQTLQFWRDAAGVV